MSATANPSSRASRRHERKHQQNQGHSQEAQSPSHNPQDAPASTARSSIPPLLGTQAHATTITTTTMPPARLLVCSIGNPGSAYAHTFHSAGHTILSLLPTYLSSQPALQKSRPYANGLLSQGPGAEFTLWQSPTLMNVSGPTVLKAWVQFLRDAGEHGAEGLECKLVVIHDELEAPLGTVVRRSGSASAKGHNGLRSIQASLRGVGKGGDGQWVRLGVGIGRPESREPDVVAGYVLRKMKGEERGRVEGCVGKVVEELRALRGG